MTTSNTYPIIPSQVNHDFLSKHSTIGVNSPDVRITYINGIRTDSEKLHATTSAIALRHNVSKVYFVADLTQGTTNDLLESAKELTLGEQNKSSQELTRLWRELIADMGGPGNQNSRIVHYAHSQGGLVTQIALKNLQPNERDKIEIHTYGSIANLSQGDACVVDQKISSYDPVPFVNPFRFYGLTNDTLIPSKENSYFKMDHGILGPTYLGAISQDGKKFVANYLNQ